MVVKEEVAAVMAQAKTRGGGRACSVAKRRSTSALAVLQLLSVLLWSCSTSQRAWVRIRCGLLVKACQRTWKRCGVRQPAISPQCARSALQVVHRGLRESGAPAAPLRAQRRLSPRRAATRSASSASAAAPGQQKRSTTCARVGVR